MLQAKPLILLFISIQIMAVHDNQESELTYLRDFVGSQVYAAYNGITGTSVLY